MDESMEGCDAVVHFAAESHVDRSIDDPGPFLRTNIGGTETLLRLARKHRVGRFHHISTDEVFGALELGGGHFDEDTPYAPRSPYAASRAARAAAVGGGAGSRGARRARPSRAARVPRGGPWGWRRARRADCRRYAIDAGRLRADLGWEPSVTFEQGIAATIAWYREHEDWW